MKTSVSLTVTALLYLVFVSNLQAAVVAYSNETTFQTALTDSLTVIDTSEYIGQTTDQLSAIFDGVTFFGQPSFVDPTD